jgi:hypothetical protein
MRPQPPKLNFNNPLPPSSTPERIGHPDIHDILKEMKSAAVTPLTAIAATPRKEVEHFDFGHPHPPPKRMPSNSGLMDDLSISDSDQDSESESSIKISAAATTSTAPVLSPLPSSPMEPMNSPPRPRSPPSGLATAAASEADDSEDDSSSESDGSSSDSSSDAEHLEPETKPPPASPPKQVKQVL